MVHGAAKPAYISVMAVADNAYSRFVFWMKLLLPLAALSILSTLFLVAETLDPEAAIPYADVDVEKILREQGVTRPNFGTVTASGARITVGAEAVRPVLGAEARFRGTELNARIALAGSRVIDIAGSDGLIDVKAGTTELRNAVLESSDGYRVMSDRLTARFDAVAATSPGPVSATGPAGDLTAGAMELSQDAESGKVLLVFKDGVRLIYRPATD